MLSSQMPSRLASAGGALLATKAHAAFKLQQGGLVITFLFKFKLKYDLRLSGRGPGAQSQPAIQ